MLEVNGIGSGAEVSQTAAQSVDTPQSGGLVRADSPDIRSKIQYLASAAKELADQSSRLHLQAYTLECSLNQVLLEGRG